MERVICPICERTRLRKLMGYVPHKNESIVCQNEYFIHVERNGQHFLARTLLAIMEEMDGLFIEENQLVTT
jgi:hypothetical protein